jgi:quercetin dioxygenase-like cupin family protein
MKDELKNQQTRKMKRENPFIEICPGITRRTVANGKTMYQMIATLAAGSRMPEHRHAREQIVHIISDLDLTNGTAHRAITNRHIYAVAANAS